jgi:hypothetical protein
VKLKISVITVLGLLAILSLDERPERSPATPENPALRNLLFGKKPNVYRVIFSIDTRVGAAHPSRGAPAIAETAVGLTRRCT